MMEKELITDKEGICILILFVLGSSLILGIGNEADHDRWISGILGIIMAIPMLLIYSRIISLFKGKDIFEILIIIFGKVIGRIVAVLYIWFAFHLGALVLRNFGEFTSIVAMPETPMFIFLLCLGMVCIIAVRSGVEILGRTCTYFIPLIFFIIAVVSIMSISQTHFEFLKPVFGNGMSAICKAAFSTFSFPYAETVLFLGIFSSLKTKKSSYKVFFWGMLISSFILVFTSIRNVAILGNMVGKFYFPSYQAVSMISIGDFIQRIEVSVAGVFIFCAFVKAAVCLLVASKGIAKMLNLTDYRSISIQTGLLMIYFSFTIYNNSMEMGYWAFKVYPYYAFPFEVIMPVIIWITAEIKKKKIMMN